MTMVLWVWVLVSTAGLCLSLFLVNTTRLDLRALGARANGRRRVALGRLVRESLRVSVHAAYIFAALIAGDVIQPPAGISEGVVIVLILMWGNVAMVVNSAVDTMLRPQLMDTRRGEPPLSPPS